MNAAVLDIPRIYTGIAEWMACMIFALQFKPRVPKRWTCLICAGALVCQCAFLELTDDLPIFFWIPCMAAAAGMMLGLLIRSFITGGAA